MLALRSSSVQRGYIAGDQSSMPHSTDQPRSVQSTMPRSTDQPRSGTVSRAVGLLDERLKAAADSNDATTAQPVQNVVADSLSLGPAAAAVARSSSSCSTSAAANSRYEFKLTSHEVYIFCNIIV